MLDSCGEDGLSSLVYVELLEQFFEEDDGRFISLHDKCIGVEVSHQLHQNKELLEGLAKQRVRMDGGCRGVLIGMYTQGIWLDQIVEGASAAE